MGRDFLTLGKTLINKKEYAQMCIIKPVFRKQNSIFVTVLWQRKQQAKPR